MLPDLFFQTPLLGKQIALNPLKNSDLDPLYAVACDPLIWELHPNKNRYQRPVFENYFKGAIESGGAYLILKIATKEIIGCSRFYDFDEINNCVFIGYTFISRPNWGSGANGEIKQLMIDHAFQKVNKIYFHVGISNFRSQRAMEKLGAKRIREIEVAYFGEPIRTNIEYLIERD